MPRPAFATPLALVGPTARRRMRVRARAATCCAAPPAGYTAVMLVPTGIGASIGGYAGDGLPSARLLASVADTLVTHPNVLNGALMYYPVRNALYVEGAALDAFAAGRVALRAPAAASNAVGLVLDRGLGADAHARHVQAAEAARATLGLRVACFTVTERPLGVRLARAGRASSWGTLDAPDALLRAARALVGDPRRPRVDAVAVVARFPDDEDADALAAYRAGDGVDAVAGAEAVISHLVTRELGVPCAHAPALPPLDVDAAVSPKAAAEELGYTFLSCVLVGLSRAPRLVPVGATAGSSDGVITVADVSAVVVPADAFGGAALMSLADRHDVLVVAVKSNVTALSVPPEAVGIERSRVVWAESYAEAAGILAAHKAGIDLASISAHVPHMQEIKSRE